MTFVNFPFITLILYHHNHTQNFILLTFWREKKRYFNRVRWLWTLITTMMFRLVSLVIDNNELLKYYNTYNRPIKELNDISFIEYLISPRNRENQLIKAA